jgi:hypothetical protein
VLSEAQVFNVDLSAGAPATRVNFEVVMNSGAASSISGFLFPELDAA